MVPIGGGAVVLEVVGLVPPAVDAPPNGPKDPKGEIV
jgi:hypothetical protein